MKIQSARYPFSIFPMFLDNNLEAFTVAIFSICFGGILFLFNPIETFHIKSISRNISGELIITLSVPKAMLHFVFIIISIFGIPSASTALALGQITIPFVFFETECKSFLVEYVI